MAGTGSAGTDDRVDPEVDEDQRRAQQRQARTGRHDPPPRPDAEGVGVLRPIEHGSPAPLADAAEADEGERCLGDDGEQHGRHEPRRQDRHDVRQHFGPQDVRGPLTRSPRCGDEVAPPQRQGLRPHDPGAGGPPHHDDDDHHAQPAGGLQVGAHDDDEREHRQHEEQIGERRQRLARQPRQVASRKPHDGGDGGGEHTGDGADEQGDAPACEDLRQHILPGLGGAEQVVPRGGGEHGGRGRRRVVGGEQGTDHTQDHEEAEQHGAGDCGDRKRAHSALHHVRQPAHDA
jgi:hypothetical protein